MNIREIRAQLAALNLPAGAAHNAEALIVDYQYPLDSAVRRAMAWHEHSQRILALHP